MKIDMSWSDFKAEINAGVPFRVINASGVYYLAAISDMFELNCTIVQNGGSDQTDYETNYASQAATYNLSPFSPGSFQNITGNTTVTVKSSPGILMGIWVNNNVSNGTLTIYDNTSASGTKIGTFILGTPTGGLLSSTGIFGPDIGVTLNVKFNTGLTIVTSGSTSNNITLVYR